MTNAPVEATIIVKSDNSHQTFKEFPDQMSPNDRYSSLIAANERLRVNLSKVFTEYVEKARAEKRTDSHEKKRKLKSDDEEEKDQSSDEYQENDDDDEEEEEEEEIDD